MMASDLYKRTLLKSSTVNLNKIIFLIISKACMTMLASSKRKKNALLGYTCITKAILKLSSLKWEKKNTGAESVYEIMLLGN